MNEPVIVCPNCKSEVKLNESLAAPLIEATRRQYEQKMSAKNAEMLGREAAIRDQQAILQQAQESIDEQVAAKVKTERASIAAQEATRARAALADDLAKAQMEKAEAQDLLKQRDAKLAEATKNEIALRKERQTLQDEKANFELEKQRAIDAERATIRESAVKDADEQARFKIAEKDKTITDLQVKLQDALRKAEQGSQQLQGEVQELELESLLREKFPRDLIEPVAKGEFGGDVLHRVFSTTGQHCGTILWESKRTKNWSDGWLSKLRDDQRTAKAEIAVIVTQVLPKHIKTFDITDGVWVTEPLCTIPIAVVLRQSLLEMASVRQLGEGQQTKMELVYQYLTGARFRQRVEAIVDKFSDMQSDLDKERKNTMRLWAKREEQIRGVIESTAGMYGDLQGIAGKSLQEIEGLGLPLIEASPFTTV